MSPSSSQPRRGRQDELEVLEHPIELKDLTSVRGLMETIKSMDTLWTQVIPELDHFLGSAYVSAKRAQSHNGRPEDTETMLQECIQKVAQLGRQFDLAGDYVEDCNDSNTPS
jgi:hypothetical protein